jgi:peroxiredoxin
MLDKTISGSLINKILIGYFTHNYETSKIMGFDKIFIHMAEKYFKTGKANGIYNDESIVGKIIKRAEKLKPIAIGSKAPELYLIKGQDIEQVNKMGFDKANTSEELTNLYYKNQDAVAKLFFKLSDVLADYTVLAFWDVDCGHCQKEIPKLVDEYHKLQKKGIDIKVLSVYTLFETDKYQKYINDHKLDWINTYDGIHFNNVVEKYDVYSTPVFYLLDKNKIIKAKRFGVDQLEKLIEVLAKEK